MTREVPTPTIPERPRPLNLRRMVRVWFLLAASMAAVGLVCWRVMPAPATRTEGPNVNPNRSGLEALVWPAGMAPSRQWRYVIIHHSATPSGTLEAIEQYHRDHLGIQDTAYHFIINNGVAAGTRDGEIRAAPRWLEQRAGAHCHLPGDSAFSSQAIGICLIGNFNSGPPTPAQMVSLTAVVNLLREWYHIPLEQVWGHGELKNTECPGRHFPMEALLWELRQAHLKGWLKSRPPGNHGRPSSEP